MCYQKPIVSECVFGKENKPKSQQNIIASRSLSGKTVRYSSNRFVQVHSPLTPCLISGNFFMNSQYQAVQKKMDCPRHFKEGTELIFGMFQKYTFSLLTSKYSTEGNLGGWLSLSSVNGILKRYCNDDFLQKIPRGQPFGSARGTSL